MTGDGATGGESDSPPMNSRPRWQSWPMNRAPWRWIASAFAAAAGTRLASVDVEPMPVLPEGQGCSAADAAIEVADA